MKMSSTMRITGACSNSLSERGTRVAEVLWPAATQVWHAAGEWSVGSLFAIIFGWPTIVVQRSGGIEKLSVSETLCG